MRVRIYAIDPGCQKSALVVFDGRRVLQHLTAPNNVLLRQLRDRPDKQIGDTLVIEQIHAMGLPVGEEIFETVYWSGRFAEMWVSGGSRSATVFTSAPAHAVTVARVKRRVVKQHLRAKNDVGVRRALIHRFGPRAATAIGVSKAPGPLYGITSHEWQALAVAVTWWDQLCPTHGGPE